MALREDIGKIIRLLEGDDGDLFDLAICLVRVDPILVDEFWVNGDYCYLESSASDRMVFMTGGGIRYSMRRFSTFYYSGGIRQVLLGYRWHEYIKEYYLGRGC